VTIDSNPTKMIAGGRDGQAAADDARRADHVLDRQRLAKYSPIIPAISSHFIRSWRPSNQHLAARRAPSCRRYLHAIIIIALIPMR